MVTDDASPSRRADHADPAAASTATRSRPGHGHRLRHGGRHAGVHRRAGAGRGLADVNRSGCPTQPEHRPATGRPGTTGRPGRPSPAGRAGHLSTCVLPAARPRPASARPQHYRPVQHHDHACPSTRARRCTAGHADAPPRPQRHAGAAAARARSLRRGATTGRPGTSTGRYPTYRPTRLYPPTRTPSDLPDTITGRSSTGRSDATVTVPAMMFPVSIKGVVLRRRPRAAAAQRPRRVGTARRAAGGRRDPRAVRRPRDRRGDRLAGDDRADPGLLDSTTSPRSTGRSSS